MIEHIGIDTHGLANPPDDPELSEADYARLNAIEEAIGKLVAEYRSITTADWPCVPGYKVLRR